MNLSRLALILTVLASLFLVSSAQAATPRANLAATDLIVSPTTLQAGATITATVKIKNGGAIKARSTKTFFLVSHDAKRSGDDLRLASIKTAKLETAKSKAVKFTGIVPAATTPGKQFLLACADGTRTVREKSERDNCKSIAITVTEPPLTGGGPTQTVPIGPTDTDGDGITDDQDLCPNTPTPNNTDSDADGKGDNCDVCPDFPNPGAAACPVDATIPDVKTGTIAVGAPVRLDGLVITAVAGNSAWAQLAGAATASYGGIELVFPDPTGLAPGNKVNAVGTVTANLKLSVASTVTTAGLVPIPSALSVTGSSLGPNAAIYDSLLIAVLEVNSSGDYGATGGWLMNTGPGADFAVLNTIFNPLPAQAAAGYDVVAGISSHDGTYPTILPRSAADIGPVRTP